jgi:hypothetical protein
MCYQELFTHHHTDIHFLRTAQIFITLYLPLHRSFIIICIRDSGMPLIR